MTKKLKGPIYAVCYIEVEFGERPEGWKLYVDLKKCIRETKRRSISGCYVGGYYGPARPLHYYEIPIEGLDKEYLTSLKKDGVAFTENYWNPEYKKGPIFIKD